MFNDKKWPFTGGGEGCLLCAREIIMAV